MFLATVCPSSEDSLLCVPYSHPHRITSTKRLINTVVSPDDGHIVARNMYRKEINVLRKNCAPRWLYLQDYTGMYGEQNIKKEGVRSLLVYIALPSPLLAAVEVVCIFGG